MRQIKFRAWSDNESKMIFPTRITFAGDVSYCYVPDDDYEYQVETSDLMQFTGLQDKDGKDIYEGDLLSGKTGKPVEISWHDIGWVAKADHEYNLKWPGWRVIGNVHETPDILRQSQ